ncbi:MAG TPA: hypothetical protein VN753_08975 [Terracidiphilus sp.]|nr:hypothetical protein [Terracidiphilus sp.]
MILNRAEKMLLNNPIRRTIQRHYEIPLLRRMSHRFDGKNVLEIGCGQGWQVAIREVRRVLKPGGLFLFEEVSKQALDRWLYRTFFDHPDRESLHDPRIRRRTELAENPRALKSGELLLWRIFRRSRNSNSLIAGMWNSK